MKGCEGAAVLDRCHVRPRLARGLPVIGLTRSSLTANQQRPHHSRHSARLNRPTPLECKAGWPGVLTTMVRSLARLPIRDNKEHAAQIPLLYGVRISEKPRIRFANGRNVMLIVTCLNCMLHCLPSLPLCTHPHPSQFKRFTLRCLRNGLVHVVLTSNQRRARYDSTANALSPS